MGLWLAWLSPIYATMCTAGTYTRRCAPQAPVAARRAHCVPHHVVAGSDRPFIWRSLGGYMGLPGSFGVPAPGRWRREVATGRSVPVAAARSQRRCALLAEGFLPAATLRLEAVECDERL